MATGGYDYEFVPELYEEYICVICHLALKSPRKIEDCGHQFCEMCFNNFKAVKNPNDDLLCPIDRQVFSEDQVFKDKGSERAILNWNVKCSNHTEGCEWIGELRNISDHERECEAKIKEVTDVETKVLTEKLIKLESQVKALESDRKKHSDKVVTLQQQLNQALQQLNEALTRLELLEKKDNPLVCGSQDPRTMAGCCNQFQWRCPTDMVDCIDNFSPLFYFKNHCFQLSLWSSYEENLFEVSLFRCRGKFDEQSGEIRDDIPGFKLYVSLKDRFDQLKKITFGRNVWVIREGESQSKSEYHSFDLTEFTINEDFHKVECSFLEL